MAVVALQGPHLVSERGGDLYEHGGLEAERAQGLIEQDLGLVTTSSERYLGRGSVVLAGVVGSVYEHNITGVHLDDALGGADNGPLALEFAVGQSEHGELGA
jgi:hypothetical protein